MRASSLIRYSYELVSVNGHIAVVYPQAGNALYEALARRLVAACEENAREVSLFSAAAVHDMEDKERLARSVVMMVQPAQCYARLPDRGRLVSRVSRARKKLAVVAESVESFWFQNQFKTSLRFDALIDVGFVSQADKTLGVDLPYLFLLNAPTREEKRAVRAVAAGGRPVPWATVGHDRGGRVHLAHKLVRDLDPSGVVFMPPPGTIIRNEYGMIGPGGLHALLGKTRLYVWTSLHDFDYYESFRFRESILAGAVPCKVDAKTAWENTGIPGIFPSVEALVERANGAEFGPMQDAAREYFLSQDLLSDRLEEVLERV